MERLQVKSIREFWKSFGKSVNSKTCIISDIDNVWFEGLLSIRTWASRFEGWKLLLMREISQKTNLLLFTNRGIWGTWNGGYVTQLQEFFKEKNIKMELFSDSEAFTKVKSFKGFGLVRNAKKPSDHSVEVIRLLLGQYDKVIYLAGQDFPLIYKDLDLINIVDRDFDKKLLKKITFVDIIK
jgi:hypothetical protein